MFSVTCDARGNENNHFTNTIMAQSTKNTLIYTMTKGVVEEIIEHFDVVVKGHSNLKSFGVMVALKMYDCVQQMDIDALDDFIVSEFSNCLPF